MPAETETQTASDPHAHVHAHAVEQQAAADIETVFDHVKKIYPKAWQRGLWKIHDDMVAGTFKGRGYFPRLGHIPNVGDAIETHLGGHNPERDKRFAAHLKRWLDRHDSRPEPGGKT